MQQLYMALTAVNRISTLSFLLVGSIINQSSIKSPRGTSKTHQETTVKRAGLMENGRIMILHVVTIPPIEPILTYPAEHRRKYEKSNKLEFGK